MGMTVVDLTAGLQRSPLLLDAQSRGCDIVHPAEVLLEQVHQQVKLITGKEVSVEVLRPVLEQVFVEEQGEE
jgi:shikimate 5-dehydrogenase